MILLLLLACSPDDGKGNSGDNSGSYFPSEDSDADSDADSDSDTDSDSDADTDSDTDTDTNPFDCKGGIPTALPYESRTIDGSATGEDLDIDNHGYIIGSDRVNLYRADTYGDVDMIMPNVDNPQAIVVLPTDDIVLFGEFSAKVERLSPSGDCSTVTTGYYLPYADANAAGAIYASVYPDMTLGTFIIRIDPFENTVDELLVWEHDYPWGITFNEDYTALYVSVVQGFDAVLDGPSRIYRVDLDENGDVEGEPHVFVEFDGDATWTEGLAVDVCGNVYASLGTKIMRISKDGKTVEEIWRAEEVSTFARAISGLAFGREGAGGTDPLKLYASNPYSKDAIEIDVGVYGKSGW